MYTWLPLAETKDLAQIEKHTGHTFEGRSAIQVSRRNGAAQNGFQKVPAKLLKILDYLEKMP